MNKEALRKELEDCWGKAWNHGYFVGTGRVLNDEDKDSYITTRLAALDDGDGEKSVKVQLEFYHSLKNIHICNGKLNIRYGTLLCSMCAPGTGINLLIEENKIEEFKRWAEPVDDGQEGKGLDDIRAWLKSQIEWLIAAKNSDEKVFNDDELDGMSIAYKAMQDKLEALPVADGEGQKVSESVPDLSNATDQEKDEVVRSVMYECGKQLLMTHIALGLKEFMEVMIVNDSDKKEYILSFRAADSHLKRFPLPSPVAWNQKTILSYYDEVVVHLALNDFFLRIHAELSKELTEVERQDWEKTRDDVKRLLMKFNYPDNYDPGKRLVSMVERRMTKIKDVLTEHLPEKEASQLLYDFFTSLREI